MLIIGTGGLASDVLSSIDFDEKAIDVTFFNNQNEVDTYYIKQNYQILRTLEDAQAYFKSKDKRFIVAIGNNKLREEVALSLEKLGGENVSYISEKALVSKYVEIGTNGVIVLHGAAIGNGCKVGVGSIVYSSSSLGHGSIIGKYVLISGQVCMSDCEIGDYSFIGIGTTIKPKTKVGPDAFVGIGSVVKNNVTQGTVVFGNPARKIK